ncbi:hypothetical protein CYK24_06940 [Trueperella bernardiae]|uniref:G5 domain-containing protein n=1 Tax=Trueperella bernardiae TaxID=59561 RepID=A0AAW6ZLW8_9ACTO|nr:G5 domain-containing protein [Trueperella bernardiae]MDK8601773.1 G5 domain-containing protein [Trueperella bernardiae]PKZ88775.1 hypothetical protein CYK24_06940 [Trueperella bernardiae]
MAERVAGQAAQHGSAFAQTPDTAEIPAVTRVVTSGAMPYAEHMNFHLVTSRAAHAPARKPRRYTKAMHVAGAASLAVFAAGGTVGFPALTAPQVEQAVAAVVDAPEEAPSATAGTVSFDVTVDGQTTRVVASEGDTYAAALANADISIAARDEVSVSLSDTVTTAPITIVRVTNTTVSEEYTIAFETERVETAELPKGEEEVATAGVEGKGTRTYQVTSRDGAESARMLLVETVTAEPVNEVIKVGTREEIQPEQAATSAAASAPASAPVPAGSSREIAQGMLASYGWGMDQWACLDALWQRESGWNSQAANPSSGAYGIPQALPGSKMASAGADWQTNPATQISWGLGYIAGRYGSPCGAWGHSQARGWY